jgi:hypothetical protein
METVMFRFGVLGLAAVLALTMAAVAEPAAPHDSVDGRYTFHRADDGYLRLDGRSGQVSLCSRRTAGWVCQVVPDDRMALEGEIARLQAESAILKKELLSRNLPLPGNVRPDPPSPSTNGKRLQLPDDAELNRMMSFIEKVWRRLVEMIASVQRDLMKKT